jgi:hypothetical protein
VTLIKLLLLTGIVVVGLLAFRGSTKPIHKVLWRAYVALVLVAAVFAVLLPDTLTTLANSVGVGRGADLLLYVLVVTFLLVAVVLFRRLSVLERRYTQLARIMAVQEASAPHEADGQQG